MSGSISFELARKRARNGRIAFWLGVVLVLAMFAMYLSPAIALFTYGTVEWPGFLVISLPGGDVDVGPAIIGTLGFLCVYVGQRVSRELVGYASSRMSALLPAAKARDQAALTEYNDYLQLWLRLAKSRWVVKLLGWLLTLAVGAALAAAAVWLRLRGPDLEERDLFFWVALAGAGFMALRLFLDWPGRPPKIVKGQ